MLGEAPDGCATGRGQSGPCLTDTAREAAPGAPFAIEPLRHGPKRMPWRLAARLARWRHAHLRGLRRGPPMVDPQARRKRPPVATWSQSAQENVNREVPSSRAAAGRDRRRIMGRLRRQIGFPVERRAIRKFWRPVDRERRSHDTCPLRKARRTRKSKALPPGRKGSGVRRLPCASGRASTLPARPRAVGPAHSRLECKQPGHR